MPTNWFGDSGVIGTMGQIGQLGYGIYNSEREADYVKELLDWKKKEGSINIFQQERDAARAANKSNQFAEMWRDHNSSPYASIDQQRQQSVNRANLYGTANANGTVQNLNGTTTDLVPGGILPQQYAPVTTPVAQPVNQPQSNGQNATVSAGAAKPVTNPATNSAFNKQKRIV